MRVLVTGANGMLGTDLCARLRAEGMEPIATDIAGAPVALDVTDRAACARALAETRPDATVHCAAYTDVDGAERSPDLAYRLNAYGSWVLASACAEHDVPLCAISTDFVFDGLKRAPYTEFDMPCPLGVYGASKLGGENRIRETWRKHWIVRTAWLYGVHGRSFPASILRAAASRPELRVVADQRGSPTCTADLSAAIVRLLASPLYGTYHVVNDGDASWYELACHLLDCAGLAHVKVTPIRAAEWPSPARRPAYSVLRPFALEMSGMPVPRHWREAVRDYIEEYTSR